MKRLRSLLLLATLAAASPARAQSAHPPDPSEVDEARTRFQRGVDLYREGSVDAALAEFNKAYELAPNYRVLYNLAQVQNERHDYVAAIALFQRYLDEGASEIPTERREQVSRDVTALRGRVAKLNVRASVAGAELIVDGVVAAVLPLGEPVLVNSGVRQIQVRKTGYETFTRTETIAGGESVRLDVKLDPVPTTAQRPPRTAKDRSASERPRSIPVSLNPAPSPAASQVNVPMWITLATTGLFTGGAIGLGVLTQQANQRFEQELGALPGDRSRIDDARAELKRDALLTDILTAGAVASGGLFLYFAISGTGTGSEGKGKSAKGMRIGPAGAGVRVLGVF